MNLKTGHLLKRGEYRVEKVLGEGGFGITYLCEQTGLARKVAVKEFFMKELCNREDDTSHVTVPSIGSREMVDRFRRKFIKEARAIAAFGFDNKHIVRIIDIFEENNTAYYVMEYVGGGSLSDKVKDGALPEADALRYIRQVATALEFVHGKHMMHLDIKPSNILLNENDETILIDFGLAKQYDTKGSQTSSTPVGISHGYAPLEQYKQGGVGTFSPATDIYSLGATLYKLLTGETPPEAGDVNDDGLPALPKDISANVRHAIEAAMQPRRKDRPQSIGEFLALLNGRAQGKDERAKSADEIDGATVVGGSVMNNEILRSTQNDKEQKPVISIEHSDGENTSTNAGETVVANAENSELDKKVDIKTKDSDNLNNSVQVDDTEHCDDKTRKRRFKNAIFAEILFAVFFIFLIFFGIKSCNDRKITTEVELIEPIAVEEQDETFVKALIVPASNKIIKGDKFTAQILLASVDTTLRPEIFVNDNLVDTENGDYSIICNQSGDFSINGYMLVDDAGNKKRYDFTQSYSVVDPTATVSASLMNVLYAGYDNPVSISIPGVPANKISARITKGQGSIRSDGKNGYIVVPTKIGEEMMIGVTARNDEGEELSMGEYAFRVRKLPDPTPFIEYKDKDGNTQRYRGGTRFSKQTLCGTDGIVAAIDDGLLNIGFRVLSFETIFYDNMGNAIPLKSQGAQFTQEQKDKFRNLGRGKRFYISHVKAIGPDNVERLLPISLEVIID